MTHLNAEAASLVGGTIAGKYRVEKLAAEGGFALLYRAHHIDFDAPVALKALRVPPGLTPAERDSLLSAFEVEAKLLFTLSKRHPAFVQVTDRGVIRSPDAADTHLVPYIVMEWLEGEALDARLARASATGEPPLSLGDVWRLLTPIAEALEVAHALQVAHRDVKPANIFIARYEQRESVKLLDLGIAKIMSATGSARYRAPTRPEFAHGFTPQYAAPEQWLRRYGATGPWTDVFALALVCVEVLTGKPALEGDEPSQLMGAAVAPLRPTPNTRGANVPRAVETVFNRALATETTARFASAGAFWAALRDAMTGATTGSTAPHGMPRTEQRHPAPAPLLDATPPRTTERSPPVPPAPQMAPPTSPMIPSPQQTTARPLARTESGPDRAAHAGARRSPSARALHKWRYPALGVAGALGVAAVAARTCGSEPAPAASTTAAPTSVAMASAMGTTSSGPPAATKDQPSVPSSGSREPLPPSEQPPDASATPSGPDATERALCCVTDTGKDNCSGDICLQGTGIPWRSAAPCGRELDRTTEFELRPNFVRGQDARILNQPTQVCLRPRGQPDFTCIAAPSTPLSRPFTVSGDVILARGFDIEVRDSARRRVYGRRYGAVRGGLQRGALCQGMTIDGLDGSVSGVVFTLVVKATR